MGECQRILHPTLYIHTKLWSPSSNSLPYWQRWLTTSSYTPFPTPMNGCEDCYFWSKASSPKAIESWGGGSTKLTCSFILTPYYCIENCYFHVHSHVSAPKGVPSCKMREWESLWQQHLESVQIGVFSTKAVKISNWRGGQTFSVIQFIQLFKYLS